MATVTIPPSPQVLSVMTNRRAPLANNPNAANSPFRVVAVAAGKRQRAFAADQRELTYAEQPPAKKQMIGTVPEPRRTLPRKTTQNATPLQKKLEAARGPGSQQQRVSKDVQQRVSKDVKSRQDVELWREHYRKQFPQFVFYFEGIPEDVRREVARSVRQLGAREEKFFSRAVTHVVTTRPIPKGKDSSSSEAARNENAERHAAQVRTIDPSLLQGAGEATKDLFDAALQKKGQLQGQTVGNDLDFRKHNSNGDVLVRARDLNMKIWALEKLERMLDTLFAEEEEETTYTHNTRGTRPTIVMRGGVVTREADLSQLLKKEKLMGPADRDMTVATQEMVPLRGLYVYVYDMDEKTRPVLMREYTVPQRKEEGKWPQFRNTSAGKCPFLEDPNHAKRQQQQQQQLEARTVQMKKEAEVLRARAVLQSAKPTDGEIAQRRVLAQKENLPLRQVTVESQDNTMKPLDPPKTIPTKRNAQDDLPPLFNSTQANRRPMAKFAGGEPVASGMQPSNITSAIRSQAISSISSTAAMPGMSRVGTTKEMHQLQKKMFERNSGNSMGSSYVNDVRAAINNDHAPPPRAAKRKAQENLAGVREDATQSEKETAAERLAYLRRKKNTEKESKPGYCENCREKFEDFETHVATRKHRKFAQTQENWNELDALLQKLDRPLATAAAR